MTYSHHRLMPITISNYVYIPRGNRVERHPLPNHGNPGNSSLAVFEADSEVTVLTERDPGIVIGYGRKVALVGLDLEKKWETTLEGRVIEVDCRNGTIMAIVTGRILRRPKKAVILGPFDGIRLSEYPLFRV